MIDRTSTSQFYNMRYSEALTNLARMVYNRIKNPNSMNVGLHKEQISVKQWQKKTLGRLTADEHPYKFSAFNKEDGEIDFNDEIKRDLEEEHGRAVHTNSDPMHQAMFELTKSIADMNDIWRSFVNPSHLQRILKDAHAIRIASNDMEIPPNAGSLVMSKKNMLNNTANRRMRALEFLF